VDFDLKQRGRASLDFSLELGRTALPLMGDCHRELAEQGLNDETLDPNLDDRWKQIESALSHSRPYRLFNLFIDWMGTNNGQMCIDAFEEMRPALEAKLKRLQSDGPSTLDKNPDYTAPDWFNRYWIHRTTGGWDGHEYMGFIHSELVHGILTKAAYGGKIFEARRDVLDELPRESYRKIFEMGAGSGRSTESLQQKFPNAEIHANDLSLRMIEEAQRRGNENGWAWTLTRGNATDTGYDDESFDLVTSFAIIHEVPTKTIKDILVEAFRLLKPGGDMLIVDVLRYDSLSKAQEWQADLLALRGGEPFWRASAELDLGALAKEVGFIDVVSERFGETTYWILRGRKPS